MYNVMEKQTETKVRQAQVVYLAKVKSLCPKEISEITGYAVSTVRCYVQKFSKLLDYAKSIFEEVKEKIKSRIRHTKYDAMIDPTGCDIYTKAIEGVNEFCYLFRFYDADNNLVCSKVGTTARQTIRERLKQELQSKTYKNTGCVRAIVDRVYNCSGLPAEGLESLIRSKYIKKYPKSFKKNDRFMNTEFDFDFCDSVAASYLA